MQHPHRSLADIPTKDDNKNGRGLPNVETVGDALGNIGRIPVIGKLDYGKLAESSGMGTKIESYIHDAAAKAGKQLNIIGGRQLQMHASEHVCIGHGVDGFHKSGFRD